jgi:hypothetical protein
MLKFNQYLSESALCPACEADPCICDDSHGFVAEASGQKYKMTHQDGKVMMYTAKDDADAKLQADKHDAKSFTRVKVDEQLDELDNKTLQSYRQKAHTQIQHYKFGGGKNKPEASSVLAKREPGSKTATDKVIKKDKERIAALPKREPQQATPYKPLGGRDEKSGRSYSEETVAEASELGDLAHQKTMKHRFLVTYSDPNHTSVSMRKEKQQKHVLVPGTKNGQSVHQGEAEPLVKKYMKKQGYKVHDVEHVGMVSKKVNEAVDKGEYDYEGQMARTQLQTTMRNCKDMIGMIKDDENMPEWVQSKITLAQDYITSARDYLQSKKELGEEVELDEVVAGNLSCMSCGDTPCQCDSHTQMVELSNKTLDSYKKKAGESASAADKKGDMETGNKRFKGIMKATFKQFANDAKK